MRSSRFKRMTWGVAFGVWASIVYAGYFLFGPHGAIGFGALFGIAITFTANLVNRWPEVKPSDRLMSICAISFALAGGFYLAYVDYGWGFHKTRAKMRDARRLQSEFHTDPRFNRVSISYEDPPRQKGEWLSVSGNVPTETDLETLRKIIDDDEKWFVEWDVTIASD